VVEFSSRIRAVRKTAIIILFSAGTLLLSGCNDLKIASRWKDRDITIDGKHNEWENALLYSEDKGVTVGFINDEKNLYMCLMAADQQVLMQSLAAGFTVWFDGMGNKKEKFGIRYPVGMRESRPGLQPKERGPQNRIRRPEMMDNQSQLEIIHNDSNEKLNISELDDYGISLKIGDYLGRFLYELEMPIQDSNSNEYAIMPKDDGTIKVGFELGKMERPEMDRRPPREGGGFPGGMKSGGGRGMPGRGNEQNRKRPEELKLEIKVKLAHK
jgi:hypothetical protein